MRKSIIAIMLLLVTVLVKAQPTAGLSAGYGSKSLISLLECGYTFNRLYAGYDQRAYLSARQPAYFGIKSAFFFQSGEFRFGPAAGAYYRLMSVDNTKYNGWRYGLGLKAGYGLFSTELYYIDKRVQFTIGVLAFTDR